MSEDGARGIGRKVSKFNSLNDFWTACLGLAVTILIIIFLFKFFCMRVCLLTQGEVCQGPRYKTALVYANRDPFIENDTLMLPVPANPPQEVSHIVLTATLKEGVS